MLEVNCDDMLDVMKRLREHSALIIRQQRRRGAGKTVDRQEKSTTQHEARRGRERQQVLSPSH